MKFILTYHLLQVKTHVVRLTQSSPILTARMNTCQSCLRSYHRRLPPLHSRVACQRIHHLGSDTKCIVIKIWNTNLYDRWRLWASGCWDLSFFFLWQFQSQDAIHPNSSDEPCLTSVINTVLLCLLQAGVAVS